MRGGGLSNQRGSKSKAGFRMGSYRVAMRPVPDTTTAAENVMWTIAENIADACSLCRGEQRAHLVGVIGMPASNPAQALSVFAEGSNGEIRPTVEGEIVPDVPAEVPRRQPVTTFVNDTAVGLAVDRGDLVARRRQHLQCREMNRDLDPKL